MENALTVSDDLSFRQVLRTIGVDSQTAAQFSLVRLPYPLWKNQVNGLHGILAWERMGLFDEARCGKTIAMQLAAVYFAEFGLKSVFVMPPSLFDQFVEAFHEIENHGLDIVTLDQSPAKRTAILEELRDRKDKGHALVMSKEIFKTELTQILLAGHSCLFFDECHMGLQSSRERTPKKNLTTYASVKKFVEHRKGQRLVLATGTPIFNGLDGTYPIISLKDPTAYSSYEGFCAVHVQYRNIMIDTKWGRKTQQVVDQDRYLNVPLLTKNLYKQATRATKAEVLNLKSPNIQIIPVTLSKSHQAVYAWLIRTKMLEIGEELIDARQQAKLRQVALQLVTDPSIGTEKKVPNAVLEMVSTLLDTADVRHNKVVLFANYRNSVRLLKAHLANFKPAAVYGENDPKVNRAEVVRFQTSPECRVLIANPLSGGVGLKLGGVSTTMIIVEPVSTPGQFDQAVSRIMLEGQKEPVVVYILKVLKTISPLAIDLMLGKAKTTKLATLDSKTLLDQLLGGR